MTTVVDSLELLTLARRAAREAAELVRERRRGPIAVADTKSSSVDVVTQADRDSEELIRSVIAAERPQDAFLGEEGGQKGSALSGITWVVDPIDGTVNYLYGIPQYAVCVAAVHGEATVAAVVIDVAAGVEYAARRTESGVEAEVLGDPDLKIGAREPVTLDQMLISTGFSYEPELRRDQAEALVRLLPQIRDIRRQGSAALDLCKVATGQTDGYAEVGIQPWDYTAAALIAEAAGAQIEVLAGIQGRRLIICAPSESFVTLKRAVLDAGFGFS